MRERMTARMLSGRNRWAAGPALLAEIPSGDVVDPDALCQWLEALLGAIGPGSRPDAEPVRLIGPSTDRPLVWQVAVPIDEEALGRQCLHLAFRGLAGEPIEPLRAELLQLAAQVRLGPSTAALASAARERGIPVRRLDPGVSLLILGQGACQRRLWAAETDRTSAIAQALAQDKTLTRELLAAVGVPVPAGRVVATADEAVEVAGALGGPVVVKPAAGQQGRGVSLALTDPTAIREAFEQAAALELGLVIVEKFIPGQDHRLLVVDGRIVAAARRDPPVVQGDGQRSIAQLVAQLNADPRRTPVDHAGMLSPVWLDDPIVQRHLDRLGYGPEMVPRAGVSIPLRPNANLSTGGTATDVTDEVHPETAAIAVEAALAVGLDVAGVDLIAADISRAPSPQGVAVVEVNAGPGLRMHLSPSHGAPRPVARAIVDSLFPEPSQNGRIPIVGVTGVNGKTTTARLIAAVLQEAGHTVGLTCTDGIRVGDRWIERGDCSGPRSARAVLLHPRVSAAVLETARGGILREGLGFDRADVGVVTNIGEGDHLGQSDIESAEDLASVKRVLVEAAAVAVLNAADPLVAAMAGAIEAEVIYFADGDPASLAPMADHRRLGGRAVFVSEGQVVLEAHGQARGLRLPLREISITHGATAGFQVENVLAATAAAWALGIETRWIEQALERFPPGPEGSPGRFNLMRCAGVTIVVDYVHNASGLQALTRAIGGWDRARRTIVYSAVGDRRDRDIIRQGEVLGSAFARVVLYEDTYNRGRAPGAVRRLLLEGIRSVELAGPAVEVHTVDGGLCAAKRALELSRPGDLLVIQPNDVDETLDWVRSLPTTDDDAAC